MNLSNRSNASNASMMLESLESRQLMSGSASSFIEDERRALLDQVIVIAPKVELNDNGVLQITGSEFADQVTVTHKNGKLTVTSGVFGIKQTFATADVKRIEANLGGGDDRMTTRGDFD